jgi:hypothetical protein
MIDRGYPTLAGTLSPFIETPPFAKREGWATHASPDLATGKRHTLVRAIPPDPWRAPVAIVTRRRS